MAHILILLGSSSDREYFGDAENLAGYFGISVEIAIISAHRNPEILREKLSRIESEGTRVVVAGAGMAAHLAGVCASLTLLPVIGVPLPGSALGGLDALLSTVQMPSGIPVATVAVGKAGANNAIILAARILALHDPGIRNKLDEFKTQGSRL